MKKVNVKGLIRWEKVTKQEYETINKIAHRAAMLLHIKQRAGKAGEQAFIKDCSMDVSATHVSGCPLRLEELLAAGEFDFLHDVVQISKHLDRKTGKIDTTFCPRYYDYEKARLRSSR